MAVPVPAPDSRLHARACDDLTRVESSSGHIVDVAQEALDRANAPICYLHRTGEEPAFAVVVEIGHWQTITAMIPEGEAITELVMHHGHIEGDEDKSAPPYDWQAEGAFDEDGD